MSTKVFGKSSLFIGRSKKLGQLSLEECGRFFGAKIFLPFRGKKEEKKKKEENPCTGCRQANAEGAVCNQAICVLVMRFELWRSDFNSGRSRINF
jgi:hypothetical protein